MLNKAQADSDDFERARTRDDRTRTMPVTCPQCDRRGNAIICDEPTFTVDGLPPYLRVITLPARGDGFRLGCSCGADFELGSI